MSSKRLVANLILGIVTIGTIGYALNRETFLDNKHVYQAAVHEAGHAVLQEEHFPNTVKSVKVEDKPSLSYLKKYYINKYINGKNEDKIAVGHTYTDNFNYNTTDMRETKMSILKAGGFSVSLIEDEEVALKWFQGTDSDEVQVANLITDIIWDEHLINTSDTNDTGISTRMMEREAELQHRVANRTNEDIHENKDKILKLADEIVKSPTKSLTGEQIREIIGKV